MARRKFPKHVEFHHCELETVNRDSLVLAATTSTGEVVYVTIPVWGVQCVSKSIRAGLDELVRITNNALTSFLKGANNG